MDERPSTRTHNHDDVNDGTGPHRTAVPASYCSKKDADADPKFRLFNRYIGWPLFNMANDRASRDAWFADPNAYADKYHLEGKHKKLLVDFDAPGIVAAGVHPLLIFLVRMHIERERGKSV